uniref:Uncharacterized protein n=1 Tax=Tetranychus urticae TaxID=32264 RepID=T1KSN3_TETUR
MLSYYHGSEGNQVEIIGKDI